MKQGLEKQRLILLDAGKREKGHLHREQNGSETYRSAPKGKARPHN
jgi:hypothetical protein